MRKFCKLMARTEQAKNHSLFIKIYLILCYFIRKLFGRHKTHTLLNYIFIIYFIKSHSLHLINTIIIFSDHRIIEYNIFHTNFIYFLFFTLKKCLGYTVA